MNRKKEFFRNTIILAIGRFSTQLVTFLCIPIYTHYLLTDDYGLIDLYQTIASFFIPIVSMRLDIAAFRFLSDYRKDDEKKQKYINSIISLLVVSTIITIVAGVVLGIISNIRYLPYVIINLIVLSAATVLQHSLRGLGLNKDYSVCSVITSALLFFSTVLFIIVLKMDARSILIASIISNIANVLFCLFKIRPKRIKKSGYLSSESKELLAYSAPMIVDATSWWIVNASDRTIISYYIDVAANGIYSVSCKISNMINSLFLIFNLSWQEAIVAHKDDKDGGDYLSTLGNNILSFFLVISLISIAGVPIIFNIVIGENYSDAYNYIPLLVYANIFSIISTLAGSVLVVYKKTKIIARTTMLAALINLIINMLLVRYIGVYAAAISTIVAYMVISLYRYNACRRTTRFKLNINSIVFYSLLYGVGCIIYYQNNSTLSTIYCASLALFLLLIYKRVVVKVISNIAKRLMLSKK